MADDAAQPTGPDPDWDPVAVAEITRVHSDVMAHVEKYLQRKAQGESVPDAKQHIGKNLWILWTSDVPNWVAPSHPQSYAERLARNHLTDNGLRDARWNGVIDDETALDELEVMGGLEPDQALMGNELQAVLDRLVATLTPKVRAAWELWWEGAKNAEIALELGISEKAAYCRVSAANDVIQTGVNLYLEEGR